MLSHDYKHLLLFLFAFPMFSLNAQGQVFTLKQGETKSNTLNAGERHSYEIKLKAGYLLAAEVMQDGIDLMVRVYAPNGEILAQVDSPNGRQGPEPVHFTSKQAGIYRLDVAPLDEKELSGKYSIYIKQLQKEATTPEGKVDQLFSPWNVPGSPGAAVAVVKNGKLHYAKGYGYAQLEYDIPITSKSVFHIASVSKQFTAFAITLLADQGKLSIDDDIRKYLPEMHDFGKTITIRHLIHHTSGLRDQWNLLALAGWRLDDVITKEQVLKLAFNQRELNFDPGAEYLYCNTGYTLMGEIVARVSGQTFAEYCRDHIFQPLGMNQTLFYDDHEKVVKNRAYSYYSGQGGFKKSVLSYANAGATSLFTTVEDLAIWAVNFKTMKVGNPDVMADMHTRGIVNSGDTLSYAFGQDIGTFKGLKMISHGGADAGYRTFLARFPDQDFAVVVFSNLGSFNPGGLALQVAEIYLGSQMTQPKPPPSAETAPKPASDSARAINPARLEAYAGQYELQPGFIITITKEDNKLMGQATGQPKIELQPQAEHTFYIKEADATIIFGQNDKGEVHQLTLKQGAGQFVCPKLLPFDAKAVDLAAFTGQFYSPELETTYTLLVKDGKLIARHQRHPDIELTASKENLFNGNAWYFGQVEFIRNDAGPITGIKVSSGRVRGVLFNKTH